MKYLKLFESKFDKVQEILSNTGWKEINPPDHEHWLIQLEYNFN